MPLPRGTTHRWQGYYSCFAEAAGAKQLRVRGAPGIRKAQFFTPIRGPCTAPLDMGVAY